MRETNESAETEAANESRVQTKNILPVVQRGKEKNVSVALNGRAYVFSFWPLQLFGFSSRATAPKRERKKTR